MTMKYNSCHQRKYYFYHTCSITPVANEVLLLQSMQYYSCLSDYLPSIWLHKNRENNPCGAERGHEKRGLVILSARHIAVHRPSEHASFDFAACSDGVLNAFSKNAHHVWQNTRHIQLKLAARLTQTQNRFSPRASSRFIETLNKFARNSEQTSRNLISRCP